MSVSTNIKLLLTDEACINGTYTGKVKSASKYNVLCLKEIPTKISIFFLKRTKCKYTYTRFSHDSPDLS